MPCTGGGGYDPGISESRVKRLIEEQQKVSDDQLLNSYKHQLIEITRSHNLINARLDRSTRLLCEICKKMKTEEMSQELLEWYHWHKIEDENRDQTY